MSASASPLSFPEKQAPRRASLAEQQAAMIEQATNDVAQTNNNSANHHNNLSTAIPPVHPFSIPPSPLLTPSHGPTTAEQRLDDSILSPHRVESYRILDKVVEQTAGHEQRVSSYLNKLFGLSGEVAVVTGAGRGIGLALARGLAMAGAKVVMADLLYDSVKKESDELNAELKEDASMAIQVNVTDKESMASMFADTIQKFGTLTIVVNNAGLAISGEDPLKNYSEAFPEEDFNRTIDLNLKAVFVGCQYAARWMIKNSVKGSIVNIASMSARVVNWPQRQSVYNASKAAVVQLTKCLAVEWSTYGIRVNCISPGYIDTPLNRQPSIAHLREKWERNTPQHRLGDAKDLVGAVIYLASSRASAFTTGEDFLIDGGYTLW